MVAGPSTVDERMRARNRDAEVLHCGHPDRFAFRMPTLHFRLPAATLLLSLWLGGCASDDLSPSHDRSRSPIPFQAFEDADTNHDGRLDRDEVAAVPDFEPLSRVFERIDADHSGYLSWNEVRAGRFPFYRLPPLPKQ